MELRNLRKKVRLSQKDVSNYLGFTTPQYISNFERGVCDPSHHHWIKLARLYKVSREDIGRIVYLRKKRALKKKIDKKIEGL